MPDETDSEDTFVYPSVDEPVSWEGEPAIDVDLSEPTANEFNANGVKVIVVDGLSFRGQYVAVAQLGQQVVSHFQERGDYGGQSHTVEIQVTKVVNTPKKPVCVEMKVAGALGGQQFDFVTRANRAQRKASLNMPAQMLLAIANAIEATKPPLRTLLQSCLQECSAEICMHLDEAAGHSETLGALAYRALDSGRWLLAMVTACSVSYRSYFVRGLDVWGTLGLGILTGLATLFLIQGLNGLWAPKSFFLETPRGKREQARLGIERFVAFRIKSLFLAVVAGLVLIALLL